MPTLLTLRTPVDIAEAVPAVLGFHPEQSLVMLTFGSPTPFHARVDFGPADEMINAMLPPAVSNHATKVMLVYYLPSPDVWENAAAVAAGFHKAGIDVIDTLRVHDGRVYHRNNPEGWAYEHNSETLVRLAVETGRVTASSRAELAERIAYREGVESPLSIGGLDDPTVRDGHLAVWEQDNISTWAGAWQRALAATPGDHPLLPHVCAVAGMAAWLAGEGAMAWCCLDRIPKGQETTLATLVATSLENAVPTTTFWNMKEES